MSDHPPCAPDDPTPVACYRGAMRALLAVGVARPTKDFDVFLRPGDRDRVLAALAAAGFRTEVTYDHGLAKAYSGDHVIDLIYGSRNGFAAVDDGWFEHALAGDVLGERARLCPPEEAIWSKAFVMDRNRYDGADVAHLILAAGDQLDWGRLVDRFGPNWRVLFRHLVLFVFVYPTDRDGVPSRVPWELGGRLWAEGVLTGK